MRMALDLILALQERMLKTKAVKRVPQSDGVALSRPSCNHRGAKPRTYDVSSSTHDLGIYVWNTEGDGMGSPTTVGRDHDASSCCGCSMGSTHKKGSSQSCPSLCDASTSSFDLNAYVWSTGSSSSTTADHSFAMDGEVEEIHERSAGSLDDYSADEYYAKISGGQRKRSKVASFSSGVNGKDCDTKTKRRRIEIKEDEVVDAWNWELRSAR